MIHDFIVLEPETKCVGRKIEYVPIIVEDEAVAASAASTGIHDDVEERELLSIHADGRRIMMPSSTTGRNIGSMEQCSFRAIEWNFFSSFPVIQWNSTTTFSLSLCRTVTSVHFRVVKCMPFYVFRCVFGSGQLFRQPISELGMLSTAED